MSFHSPDVEAAHRIPAAKRRQIIEGAAHVFSELGYEGASMSRIAEQATVSKGTLYNYFSSKSDLFTAFVEMETAAKRAYILGSAAGVAIGSPDDLAAALRGMALRLVESMVSPEARTLYRIVHSEADKFPHLARVFFDAGPRCGATEFAGWLRARGAEGWLAIGDVDLAAEQFVALCRGRLWMECCLGLRAGVTTAEIERVVAANVALFLNTYGTDKA